MIQLTVKLLEGVRICKCIPENVTVITQKIYIVFIVFQHEYLLYFRSVAICKQISMDGLCGKELNHAQYIFI